MSFIIRDSDNQKGLFTDGFVEKDHILFTLDGPIVHEEAMEKLPQSESMNLLQVLTNEYVSLQGTREIFVNHSCNPNCGVKTLGRKAVLVAIRKIKPNEEITFDYSSTSTETKQSWHMKCHCLSWNCRKDISGFQYLSDEQQKYLIDKEVVPQYVLDFVKENDES